MSSCVVVAGFLAIEGVVAGQSEEDEVARRAVAQKAAAEKRARIATRTARAAAAKLKAETETEGAKVQKVASGALEEQPEDPLASFKIQAAAALSKEIAAKFQAEKTLAALKKSSEEAATLSETNLDTMTAERDEALDRVRKLQGQLGGESEDESEGPSFASCTLL